MNVSVRKTPKLKCFSLEQIQEIAAALSVDEGCDVRRVTFSETAPANTQLPWQQINGCGGEPLGKIKQFKNGEWV